MSYCENLKNTFQDLINDQKMSLFLFFFGIQFKIIILLTLTIDFYITRNDYVWFNSKILTINDIFQENYKNYKIYQDFRNIYYYNALNFSYYDLLKNSTKDTCGKDLKQCGILDTYGNKLCLYKDYPCPINEIIVDSQKKSSKYNNEGYSNIQYHMINDKSKDTFYYRNTSFDKKIISTLFFSPDRIHPMFIGNHNFIFDIEAFEKKFEEKFINIEEINNINTTNITDTNTNNTNTTNIIKEIIDNKITQLNFTKAFEGEEDDEIPIWYNVSTTKAKLVDNSGLQEYIEKQLNKTNNNDTNYEKLYFNIYFRNFYGFENAEQMDIFKNTNFTIYKNIFPHNLKLGIIIFFEIFFLIFIIVYIRKLIEDKEDPDNVCKEYENLIIISGMCIYCFSLIYYLIIFIKSLVDLKSNNTYDNLKKINCDKYFKDFINEFIKKYNKKSLIVFSIIFSFISLFLYIISIIFVIIEKNIKKNNSNIKNNNINGGGVSNDQNIIPFEQNDNNSKNINNNDLIRQNTIPNSNGIIININNNDRQNTITNNNDKSKRDNINHQKTISNNSVEDNIELNKIIYNNGHIQMQDD